MRINSLGIEPASATAFVDFALAHLRAAGNADQECEAKREWHVPLGVEFQFVMEQSCTPGRQDGLLQQPDDQRTDDE